MTGVFACRAWEASGVQHVPKPLSLQEAKVAETAFRFPLPMHEEWPELRRVWTMHNQYWVLIRKHAAIVDDDTFVEDLFSRHCHSNRIW